MKAQDYYREYQQKTLEMGFSPIGRQRFNGIIKTISTLNGTIDHIKEKQANEAKMSEDSEVCQLNRIWHQCDTHNYSHEGCMNCKHFGK